MQIQNGTNQNFGQLYLTKSALYASPRTFYSIEKDAGKLMKLADDVDIFINKKLFKDFNSDATIDLIIKVQEKRPEAATFKDAFINFIKKPILKSEKDYAGMNFGMFDSPLDVATKLKANLLKKINK